MASYGEAANWAGSEGQRAFDGLRWEGGRARWGRSVRKCRGCAGKPGTLVRQERRGVRGVAGRRLEGGSGPGCGDLDCQPRPRALELTGQGAPGITLFSPLFPLLAENTSRLITGSEGFPPSVLLLIFAQHPGGAGIRCLPAPRSCAASQERSIESWGGSIAPLLKREPASVTHCNRQHSAEMQRDL